jgi:hypothetical protein
MGLETIFLLFTSTCLGAIVVTALVSEPTQTNSGQGAKSPAGNAPRANNAEPPGGDQNRKLTNATWWIAAATFIAAGVGFAQWWILSGTLDEMRDEQRPWVYADVSIGGPIFRNQSGGFTIPLTFIFHNTGHLPALYVSPDVTRAALAGIG